MQIYGGTARRFPTYIKFYFNFILILKKQFFICLGCGDFENLTFGSESRNYIN